MPQTFFKWLHSTFRGGIQKNCMTAVTMLYSEGVACPEMLMWIGHAWPPKPSATVVTKHTSSHNNETLGGFLSQLPNYEAYILQPF
jgi:hypothetical protein